jgi:DNA-binding transcriptional ArsR family regulator
MKEYEKEARILKALSDKTRLQILECIQNGISNPGEISRELKRHRATIEKHLRVLLAAEIVEKVPSLTRKGQLTIQYRTRKEVADLLRIIQEHIAGFE